MSLPFALAAVPALAAALLFRLPATAADGFLEAARPAPELLESVGTLVPDTPIATLDGSDTTLAEFVARKPLTVIALTGTDCPLCRKYAPSLARLEREWSDRDVQFLFLYPPGGGTPEEIRAEVASRGFRGAGAIDSDARLAAALGARTTTEAFVLDSSRTILYRGAVDDQYGLGYQKDAPEARWLHDALTQAAAGMRPAVAATTAPGCDLDLSEAPAKPAPVTWHGRISRIVQQRCQDCHHQGGVAPFALESRDDLIAHAGMIRRVVRNGTMPPWYAGPVDGQPRGHWANDLSLSESERADVLAWLAGDRAEGSPADAPLPRERADGWTIGTPDHVVDIPREVQVKAEGRMDYVLMKVKTEFPEDRWLSALEVRPTALAQVHHVLVFVLPGDTRGEGRASARQGEGEDFLAVYVPGHNVLQYPPEYGKKLPAGATLLFQLHYTPNGTAAVDRTRLGLKFSDAPPAHEVRVAAAKAGRLRIPPGAANHRVKASLPVPFDVQVLAFMPHMHVRGKAFRYEVVAPDGSRSTLLDVPRYDFNWQLRYRLATPVAIAAGSRIEATAWYDNSAANPANPDPTRTVGWGWQTEDEMMLGYLEFIRTPSDRLSLNLTPRTLRSLGRKLDLDGDGRVSADEAGESFRDLHLQLDANGDGFVTREEAVAALRSARG